MKAKDLKKVIEEGKKVIVQFKKDIDNYTQDSFEPKMVGTIVGVTDEYADENCATFLVDLNDFEEKNKEVAQRIWYDKEGKATLTWFETSFYPKDGIEQMVLDNEVETDDVFKVIEGSNLLKEFSDTETTYGYVEWLENKVMELREVIKKEEK